MARFLDESLPRHVTAALAGAGHDVQDARDCGLRGAPDGAVHARAVAEGRVLTLIAQLESYLQSKYGL